VTIGGALAEARGQAGLTIRQVSDRTRIRETIIRDIERDDYAACGGDFYARGHIRAIARVVGTDPVPLIAEYDAAHAPPPEPDLHGQDAAANGHGHDRFARRWQRQDRTGLGRTGRDDAPPPDLPGGSAGAGPTGSANGRPSASAGSPAASPGDTAGQRSPAPRGITAAEAFRPAMPLDIRGGRRSRLPGRTGGLALVVLAVIGTLTYLLLSGSAHGTNVTAPRSRGSGARHHSTAPSAAHHTASPPAAPPSVQLVPVSAAAFGPAGAGQGDNPALAALAIANTPGEGWQTDWYSSADFAGLQSGTGLLLDMGKPVTVSTAQLTLGPVPGGSLQLRAGNTPTLSGLQPVADSATAGGTVTLHVSSPMTARYLLIWFTSLPSDNLGTYQGFIYGVRLTGTS
jgi:transcriptional regulator with XRE-family HTH domain